jgi:NTE family protein
MSEQSASTPKIALALSGGGARAMAFHLGCLRALHSRGILARVETISAVSGGSVLAALYCHHAGDFAAFESAAKTALARGFVTPALRKIVMTLEGLKALLAFVLQLPLSMLKLMLGVAPVPSGLRLRCNAGLDKPLFRRFASRTTILRRVFADDLFAHGTLAELREDRPKLIIVACELRTKSAFYFARNLVGSWKLGRTDPGRIQLAHAVVASAAYPALLPALDEYMKLNHDGRCELQRVILTDGGVYDNLGLAPLWPDRNPEISLHADSYNTIIACRAGYGPEFCPPQLFWPSRMLAVIDSIHTRTQNFAMKRLYDLKKSGDLAGFITPYLGQADGKLAFPPPDLVSGDDVAAYPTDFSAMPQEWIEKLSKRGEQLTLALLREHLPHL